MKRAPIVVRGEEVKRAARVAARRRASMSLHDVLAALGYTTRPGTFGKKEIVRDGEVALHGTAHDVWTWLRVTGQWPTEIG